MDSKRFSLIVPPSFLGHLLRTFLDSTSFLGRVRFIHVKVFFHPKLVLWYERGIRVVSEHPVLRAPTHTHIRFTYTIFGGGGGGSTYANGTYEARACASSTRYHYQPDDDAAAAAVTLWTSTRLVCVVCVRITATTTTAEPVRIRFNTCSLRICASRARVLCYIIVQ